MSTNEITYTAEEYARTKQEASFRNVVEWYTISSLIGDSAGLRILDAGCGDGIYARKLVDSGAEHVLGIDCAEDFIDMANDKNKGYEDKIEYHRAFVQDFFGKEDMDIVVAAYVLSYPRNPEEAIAYCKSMASHLKKGGRFVGFNNNTFESNSDKSYEKYGFTKEMNSTDEGSEVIYRVKGMTDPIINFYLNPEIYERAFEEAGFSEFQWKRVLLEPSEENNPYWNDFFNREPPFVAMVAKKD